MTKQYGPSYVRAIAPYVAGKPISEVARQFGLDEARIVKLASNENPLGMPESAQRAMAQAASELGRYPDSNAFELKAALSAHYGVPADWITLGNGSNDILEIAAHAIVEKSQSVIYSQYAFAIYALATQGVGARSIVVPATHYGHDLDAMLAAIADDTRLIFVANPNNPTGTFVDGPTLDAFLAKVPPHVVVVLDEAYTEYLAADKRYDSIGWVRRYPNLLVSRTFSKAFGLAGLRIGFAIAQPELTDLLNRLRQPFNVNTLAQAAAVAALNDKPFVEKSAALNAQGYRRMTEAFDKLGLEYLPSHGNFVLVRVGNDANAGDRVNLELLKQGIIVRPVGSYGLPQWLRVTIGLPEENDAFLAALEKTLATV
ncbi:MAG TPA: histidinol-phosphate transaminase [Paraburkholderia sp.]|jgi:histidinol-phosphate aminotransferase